MSPRMFRLWGGIWAIGAALERRVWLKNGPRLAFPNLFVLEVAPPGVGKQVINDVKELLREVRQPGTKNQAFKIAPDNVTKAALIDRLAKSKQVYLPKVGPPVTYHSLQVAAEEFGVLLPAYDLEYIGTLNSIYNNPPLHEEERRHGTAKEVSIEQPQLSILGGAQPGWMATTLPEEAWSMGLASRMIMIYSPETPIMELFYEPELPPGLKSHLAGELGKMSMLYGGMKIEAGAVDALAKGHREQWNPVPQHTKLTHYIRRRTLHIIKLSIVAAISRSLEMVIRVDDVTRAWGWLREAELVMPDIFRDMIGKSDSSVLEELHFYISQVYNSKKKTPVPEGVVWTFLSNRVPSDRIEKLIGVAERSGLMRRDAITLQYTPRPKHEWGIE